MWTHRGAANSHRTCTRKRKYTHKWVRVHAYKDKLNTHTRTHTGTSTRGPERGVENTRARVVRTMPSITAAATREAAGTQGSVVVAAASLCVVLYVYLFV